ncbi:hypothetical protein Dsin_009213 [Dipteronia sinensis]|uniref:Uncharacterized protein n=1 Tax=Dipteronia sinensis TaxID=43782 RepID=A0AAE0EBE8_9ROSI|nr:hypothetical protein Dsin_009213 [Dipteronia sinensis]
MAANLLRALLQEEEDDDDDDDDYASLLAIATLEEEQHLNKGQSTHRRGSILGHAVIQRYRVQVEVYDSYFVQRQNATETIGLSSLQKMTTAMRMLAY